MTRCDSGTGISGALSLRRIAKELAATGLLNERGQEYDPNAVKRLIEGWWAPSQRPGLNGTTFGPLPFFDGGGLRGSNSGRRQMSAGF